MSLLRKLRLSLHRHGLLRTLGLIVKNVWPRRGDVSDFDARYGTSTSEFVPVSELDVDEERLTHAVEYEPTPPESFQLMIGHLPEDIRRFTFVDIGAGKGRVLILASELGFARVVGVEFSPALCDLARRNVGARPVTIVNEDAMKFDFPLEPLVVYMFNPFDAPVMEVVVGRIEASLVAHPRECWVVYHYPNHRHLFGERFALIAEGDHYCVFRAGPQGDGCPEQAAEQSA